MLSVSMKEQRLDVVVAVISRPLAAIATATSLIAPLEFLIAMRTNGPFAGDWEFPGGKVDAGESQYEALCREVQEEVGLEVLEAHPLMSIVTKPKTVAAKSACLHVWQVSQWRGEAHGAEGQPVRWTTLSWQDQSRFLPPNRHMFTALRLRPALAILCVTPHSSLDDLRHQFLAWHSAQVSGKIDMMVRLRAENISTSQYVDVIQALRSVLEDSALTFILDVLPQDLQLQEPLWLLKNLVSLYFASWWAQPELQPVLQKVLSRQALVAPEMLRGASCHSLAEIQWSCSAEQGPGAHYYCLSPVAKTASHPESDEVLGWQQWSMMIQSHEQPAFALGGVTLSDLSRCKQAGGFGIAGIRAFL